MPPPQSSGQADRQLPLDGEIFLDHVGHFVRDRTAARAALARAGFVATPISIQVNPDAAGGPPRPSGTRQATPPVPRGYVEGRVYTARTAPRPQADRAPPRCPA